MFNRGDKVVCVDNLNSPYLTKGKIYKIHTILSSVVIVINDRQEIESYYPYRFVALDKIIVTKEDLL